MRLIMTLFIVLFSSIIYAQNNQENNIEVTYNFIDLFRNRETKSLLICNKSKAAFVNYLNKIKTPKARQHGNTILLGGKEIDIYHLFDRNENTLTSYKSFNGKDVYKILDIFPNLTWDLNFKTVKQIQKYSCNKAKVSFRGRTYIAWYTTEIPISFGPWKFNGLPGLILEINDITNTFTWVVSKIVYPSKKTLEVPYKKVILINSLKEYQVKVTEDTEMLRSKIESKLSKKYGFSVPRKGSKGNSRAGIELIFEWEIDDE